MAALSKPFFESCAFESPQAKKAIQEFRQGHADTAAGRNLEAECRKVFELYKAVPGEKRLIKKRVEIFYRDAEGHEASQVFEKNYKRQCNQCKAWRTSAHKLQKCARCHMAYYCNREHQRADWLQHKPHCVEKLATSDTTV